MRRLFSAFRAAAIGFARDGCAFAAQAVAFNAIFSLFPLSVLGVAAISLVFHDGTRRLHLLAAAAPTLYRFVASNMHAYAYGRGVSSAIAFLFLLWSGKNLFLGLAYALDRAFDAPAARPVVHNLVVSIIALPVVGIALVIATALPPVLSIAIQVLHLPDARHLVQLGGYAVSLLAIFAVSTLLYTFLPSRALPLRFGIPGAIFTAVTWPALQFGFTEYTLHVDVGRIYGALSAPLALLLWLYLAASVFLYGAELCVAWERTGRAPKDAV
jgi:membrane protein